MSLKNRSFLKLLDYTPAEIEQLLDLAADLKAKKKAGIAHDRLHGKNIALIFEKTSTRTRCSFEVAAHDLGMQVTYLDPSGSQIGKKESIADTARVLGRMFDGIEYRGYGQQIVEDLAHYAGVPVWNGLTNEFHPTQILADFLTIREHFGHLKGIHFVYFGDARYNMGNSLMVGCAKMGLHFTACAPKKYQPDAALVAECQKIAAETGATLTFEEDPAKAAQGADVLYTDVWVSMGEPVEVPDGGLFAEAKGLIPDGLTVDGIDYRQAAGDVRPALGDPRSLYIAARDGGVSPADFGRISLLLPSGSGLSDAAEQINSAWQKEFSLFFSVEEVEPEEFQKRLESGDYTIALAPVQAEGGSVYAALAQFSPTGGGLTGYSDALYTTQLSASATATGSTRCSLLAACERQLLEQAVAVPLFTQQKRLLLANGIKGLVFDPFGPVLDVTYATKS